MTSITHERDPSNRHRTIYTIVASSQIEAATAIRRLMDLVDVAFDGVPGHARFSHPFWTDNAWHAAGDVEIYAIARLGDTANVG